MISNKAQAMIIDALFFLMICGMSAAILAWASSIYGNQALEAYNYLYLSDVESSSIQVLSEISYMYKGNKLFWVDQFGRYLAGEFNESDERFKLLIENWDGVCRAVGNPLVIEIYPEDKSAVCEGDVCADLQHPIILSCAFNKTNEERYPKIVETSAIEEIMKYVTCKNDTNVDLASLGLVDLGARESPDLAHRFFLRTSYPTNGDCDGGIRPEPPYYASPKIAKLCHNSICDVYTKVYY